MGVLRRVHRDIRRFELSLLTHLLPVPILVFYIMVLAGCTSTSPGLPEIYTLKIRSWPNESISEINLGYFALCFSSHTGFQCGTTTGLGAEGLIGKFNLIGDDAAGALRLGQIFSWALSLQRLIPPLLTVAFSFFVLGLLFMGQIKRQQRRIRRGRREGRKAPSSKYTLMILLASTAFGLASAVSVQLTTAALQFATSALAPSSITVTAGTVLIVLQWLAFGFSAAFVLSLYLATTKIGAAESKEEDDAAAREASSPATPDPEPNSDPAADSH